jgi:2-hydroxy-3-keto-5-methylthiopentenyl-1-phosphate phosphatase
MMRSFRTTSVRLASIALPIAAALLGCSDPADTDPIVTPDAPKAKRHLDAKLVWVDDNRERLDAMLDTYGNHLSTYSADRKPVAIFDWDNTVIKNDVGDVTTFWMIRNDKILQPPGKSWAMTSPYLSQAAITALDAACGMLAEPGQPLPTSQAAGADCADEIVSIYYNGATVAGDDGFEGWNYRTFEPSYAWTVQLQAGYTPEDISGFADQAITAALAAEEGSVQMVGTTTDLNAYLRIYEQIKDLISALQEDGFDVWVLSASSQHVVEPFAARVNVAKDRVIGVRAVIDGMGKTTYNLQGCGAVPDGTNDGAGMVTGNSLITYIEGKRCWMNKVIYGISGADAEKAQEDKGVRPVFGAGDSDTDVSFLQDASALKLVINRNRKELMCNAYNNANDAWIVNPMFIAPRAQLADGYACSKDACKDKDGNGVPCVDELGKNIPDQVDTVFCNNGVYCER